MAIFVGVDWAEAHHDVCVKDESGRTLATRRIPEGIEGVRLFHELLAGRVDNSSEVVVGIETDRGLLVRCLGCSWLSGACSEPVLCLALSRSILELGSEVRSR